MVGYMCAWLHVWLTACVVGYMCGRLQVWLATCVVGYRCSQEYTNYTQLTIDLYIFSSVSLNL